MLVVRSLHCAYGRDRPVVKGFDLELTQGEIHCLLGPSGSGKSTILRAIMGFLRPQSGEIRLRDKMIFSRGQWLPTEKRRLGWVPQDLGLFPHQSVAGNVGFGLHGMPRGERKARVREVLEQLDIKELGARFPHELSGGQQQRVALARALAPEPDVILMDEAFSALDRQLRTELSDWFGRFAREAGLTVLMVSHDQDEAFALTDSISILSGGRVEQAGTAEDCYLRPASTMVANFIGEGTWLRNLDCRDGQIDSPLGSRPLTNESIEPEIRDMLIRPEHLRIIDEGSGSDSDGVTATVVDVRQRNDGQVALVQIDGDPILIRAHRPLMVGDVVIVGWDVNSPITFPADNRR